MRLSIFFIFSIVILSCSKKQDTEVSVKSDQAELMADSLQAVTDSILDTRRMHAMYQGQHVHNATDNLAEVAHQDPELDRRIRRSIRDNRERQLQVYESQNSKMFEFIREKRRKQLNEMSVRMVDTQSLG